MDAKKLKKLKAMGGAVTTVQDFLGLSTITTLVPPKEAV
jgi:hypothetical protein